MVCAVAGEQLFIITTYYPDENLWIAHRKRKKPLQCPVCGGQLKNDKIREEVWVEDKLLVIDNLPAKVCQHCGESIIDYSTMKKIEKIIEKFKHKEIAITKFTAYEIDTTVAALA